jgi:plasmid replication initiation protein
MDLEKRQWEQANELTRAIKGMSNFELKTLFGVLAIREQGDLIVKVGYRDFCSKLSISKGGKTDKIFDYVTDNLISRSVIHIPKHLSRTNSEVKGSIIPTIRWNKGEDRLEFKINEDIVPFLDDLKGNKTWFYIEQLAKFRGDYTPLVYQFCKTRLGCDDSVKYRWYINPSESNPSESFRTWLGLEEKYPRFNTMREKVIEPAFTELNEKASDIQVKYKIYYRGRSAFALDLVIESKEKKAKPQITESTSKVPNQIKPKRGRIVEKMPVYSEPDPNKVIDVDLDELQALVKKLEEKRIESKPPKSNFFDFDDIPSAEPADGQTTLDDFIKE